MQRRPADPASAACASLHCGFVGISQPSVAWSFSEFGFSEHDGDLFPSNERCDTWAFPGDYPRQMTTDTLTAFVLRMLTIEMLW